MSNKLIKYRRIEAYICSDNERKLRSRFAFMIDWARGNKMNIIYDRRNHTITFKFPQLKIYYIFLFCIGNDKWNDREKNEHVVMQIHYVDLYDSPIEFVKVMVEDMEDHLGIKEVE